MAGSQGQGSSDGLAGRGNYRVLSGYCPDPQCLTKLFFPAYDSSVECTNCGQRHQRSALQKVEEVRNPDVALHNILKNLLVGNFKPKKGADTVKVLGLSNYQCKLLSPLLSRYGMDKKTGEACLLRDMGQGEVFDCGILADRAFLIEPEHIEVTGYGRDNTGSMKYLKKTLEAIHKSNGNEERLLPIHADGDGHCLVHAVSRSLIGRELFWHALRDNLKQHFTTKLDTYKELFRDFIDVNEWEDIIAECDPYYLPQSGEPMGLRNIHIFGLANVLRRPIVLLDSLIGIQSSGDYTGVFLPGLQPPEKCRGKDGELHKPLCLAWSNSGRNHYIALVGVKGRPVPKLPNWMFPKAWGMPQDLIPTYIDMDEQGRVEIGGNKCLQDKYILKLVSAMEKVFVKEFQVSTALVADYHQYVYKSTGIIGVAPERVVEQTRRAVAEKRLFRCLICEAVMEWSLDGALLKPGGALYQLAVKLHGRLNPDKKYSFRSHDLICSYDAHLDVLVPEQDTSKLHKCQWCQGTRVRHLNGDGSIQYENGDRTLTPSNTSRCQCGFKHYWDGKEYDNLPEMLPVTLEWNGKVIGEKVYWFQHESDPTLNSNVFEVAQKIVQKHFPGEFGSERLVQKVVDSVLRQTAVKPDPKDSGAAGKEGESEKKHEETDASWRVDSPSKIILTGFKHKTFHKEELTQSQTEQEIHRRVEQKAATQQKRKTDELAAMADKQKAQGGSKPKTPASSPQSPQGAASSLPSSENTIKQTVSPSGGKRIRVSTSDGRQIMVTLDHDMTYPALVSLLANKLEVDSSRMKLKHGFPPRELGPPAEGEEQQAVPLQNGDRLTVELLPDLMEQDEPVMKQPEMPWPVQPPSRKSWSGFDANAHDHSAHDLLNQLTQLQEHSDTSDSLDTSIRSLALMASLMGKDLWTYVQAMPHLFSVGGLFYQQVARDLGLIDGKHCTLPALPNKVFRYNATEDRLELCLEPHGHFPVEPNLEARVLGGGGASNVMHTSSPSPAHMAQTQRDVSIGGSGVIVNKSMQSCKQVAFTGQAHSLGGSGTKPATGGDEKMPQDLEPTPHLNRHPKLKAMKFHNFSNSGSRPSSIEEEDESEGKGQYKVEEVSMEKLLSNSTQPMSPERKYKRMGPGYTVLEQEDTNEVNVASEAFQALASQIGTLVHNMEVEEEVQGQRAEVKDSLAGSKNTGLNVKESESVEMKGIVTDSEQKSEEKKDVRASDSDKQMDISEGHAPLTECSAETVKTMHLDSADEEDNRTVTIGTDNVPETLPISTQSVADSAEIPKHKSNHRDESCDTSEPMETFVTAVPEQGQGCVAEMSNKPNTHSN